LVAKKKGRTVFHGDAQIAGIYLANQVNRIVTRKVKNFENLGLKVDVY